MPLEAYTYYSDPHFTVFKVPPWRANMYSFLSTKVWGNIPSPLQRKISKVYSSLYNKSISKRLIKPYIKFHYTDKDYLDKFKPPFGKSTFDSFQDFFTREFKSLPKTTSEMVWPCEGLLCDLDRVKNIDTVHVKCDERTIETIFGVEEPISEDYIFSNVFLHNKNYHRIHAPVKGKITRIQHIPGDLVILRPWIYKENPSVPAFRNERINIDIVDEQHRTWYLSIVGGPAVGTIQLPKSITLGTHVDQLDEIALFLLGSTCCMAAPEKPRFHEKNTFVEVGASY